MDLITIHCIQVFIAVQCSDVSVTFKKLKPRFFRKTDKTDTEVF